MSWAYLLVCVLARTCRYIWHAREIFNKEVEAGQRLDVIPVGVLLSPVIDFALLCLD